eukprot:CAMPEP_0206400852 /NCGR_PEP_ID=MMETSP0294-20121207/25838_1 /ASSEMBLY_ACC=CAM_ASM_000327 /TAXON_ID=39354 /ORGANISM="Heterosigma akashiwo, Strain CCMP2393" /LENGTH=67 /DNA_ID=CAMNT_0053857275 /DNA_START=86 /DNA_END=289 /DNA_ORIENTATION=+
MIFSLSLSSGLLSSELVVVSLHTVLASSVPVSTLGLKPPSSSSSDTDVALSSSCRIPVQYASPTNKV